MASVIVIGGGPAGLSAGLFTAKNDLETTVFDTDETWMHSAHLYNYPGIESIGGTELVERIRDQIGEFDADYLEEEVTGAEAHGDHFHVETADESYSADYVILATGADRDLAGELDCAFTEDDVVDVDLTMETSVDGVYATGAMVRVEEWQAVIAAGDGAAAALNILTKEKGDHYHDFDTPED